MQSVLKIKTILIINLIDEGFISLYCKVYQFECILLYLLNLLNTYFIQI